MGFKAFKAVNKKPIPYGEELVLFKPARVKEDVKRRSMCAVLEETAKKSKSE